MKHHIIFLDSGDTLVDESTEVRNQAGDVVHAQLFPGAKELVERLKADGYRIALVADGTVQSFLNIYKEQEMEDAFEFRSVSQAVGEEKPHQSMFLTAMEDMGLTQEDRGRIIMVGNNVKRDIAGANRLGLTSILMSLSPRYPMVSQAPEEVPDYVASCPAQVYEIVDFLESQWENRRGLGTDCLPRVERWGVFELAFEGKTQGNPFTDYQISATFSGSQEQVTVDGFYDGDGVYRVRFMPSFEGEYSYRVEGSFSPEAHWGRFLVTPAKAGNHGPVRVANQYHFAYEDGTPCYPLGTTCYNWVHQPQKLQEQTLRTLSEGYFNKLRFCIFPKHYDYNFTDPECFPFEGIPCSAQGMDQSNFMEWTPEHPGNRWDFTRFVPEYFRRLERRILDLQKLGIQADLIVMHPYDRWGFSKMDRQADDRYWNYVIARFAAYRNVWWSLANEYDLMKYKTMEDWEHYAELLCQKDPYRHLRSIHNCFGFYDHTRPWITHCSIQRQDVYKCAELTQEYRTRYGKPVVLDEIAYEGNIQHGWGNISGQELVRRFWEAALRGGYGGHGETYLNEDGILWWSHGGVLHGESQERVRFLHQLLCQTPGIGLKPAAGAWDELLAVPEDPAQQGYYLFYYGFNRPSFRDFQLPEGEYQVEIIDTWNMTITDCGRQPAKFRLSLPGKEWICVRARAV